VQVHEVLHKVTQFVEDHILMACNQFLLFLFLCLENSFQKAAAFLEKFLGFFFSVRFLICADPVLFVDLFFTFLAFDCVVNSQFDYELNTFTPVGVVAPHPVV
jgi:hypothetical protein